MPLCTISNHIAYLGPIPSVIPAFVITEYQYTITRFPPSLCAPRSGSYMYYFTAIPLNIIIMAGCMMLVSTLHKVHKVRKRERERERERDVQTDRQTETEVYVSFR